MALLDNVHYVDSVGYTAVTAWSTGATIAAGALRRQTAPANQSERVFVAIVAGTTNATTEPTWNTSRGTKTTDNTVTWMEITGLAGVNGDITNTPNWSAYHTNGTAGTLGQLIKNGAASHLFVMTTAGTIGSVEPTWNTTTGATTTDNGATWTCIGPVGNFTGNQAPHAKLTNPLASGWAVAGNSVYVKSSSAESSSSVGLTGPGTVAAPVNILCHDGLAYPPASANLTTGASVTCSNSSVFNINGIYNVQGIEFIGSNATSPLTIGSASLQKFKNCKLTLSNNSSSAVINLGLTNGGKIVLDNTQMSFANVGQAIQPGNAHLEWINTASALQGAAVPTKLFGSVQTGAGGDILVDGVDLSAAGSGKTLVQLGTNGSVTARFQNCKLGASVTVGTITNPAGRIDVVNCNSGGVNYNNETHTYEGDLTTETTIVHTGGATDGTTPVSWKVVTSANCSFLRPFHCPPIAVWNDNSGASKTLTIECRGAAVPNNDEVWVEVEYLGSSGSPASSFVSNAKTDILATAAAQTSSSEAWGGSTASFKLQATFTPQMKGFVVARVRVGKASSTFYVDPKILIA